MIRNPRFLKLLLSKGIVSEEDLEGYGRKFSDNAFSILMHLVQRRIAKRSELGKLWGDSIGISYVDLEKTLFDRDIVQSLPETFARRNHIILVYKLGEAVTAVTSHPTDESVLREAEKIIGKPISPLFAFPDEIEAAVDVEYRSSDGLKDLSGRIGSTALLESGDKITREQLEKIAGSEAVIELAREIILLGIKEHASDIHIDPGEDLVRVRFRIDGVLQDMIRLEHHVLSPLASRLKILADVDIAARRKPQEGRINFPLSNKTIDMRFSCVPTIYGEKTVLRILGQSADRDIPDLLELNFSRSVHDKLTEVLSHPNGIFFVTGPTGSGKTTTLFAALKYLNKPGVNIMSIEDPIEYRLPGINQVQVNPGTDLDFAMALRSFLRQDPDIILVGEIRDLETARIAAQAALTGHLVLATLHTNDALLALARLIDIGVEPSLLAPSLIGTMAQRLVRKICEHCKVKYRLSKDEAERFFLRAGDREFFFYRGKGCGQCNQTGYSGRIAVHEICVVDDELRRLIVRDTPVGELYACAEKHGYRPMYYDGLKKVLRGLTTISEIDRVCRHA